ncbi:MAG: hypothetical protein AAF732_11095 [Pseudomonadota bacterium]
MKYVHQYATAISAGTLAVFLFTSAALSTERNREQAKANFIQADVNQDQHLDLGEFTTFINLNADHGLGNTAMIRRLGLHSRAFSKVDANGDGVVSADELAARAGP